MTVRSEKINMILELILKGGFDVYKKFKQVLKETKHDTILIKMINKEEEIIKEMGMYLCHLCDVYLDTTKPVFGFPKK